MICAITDHICENLEYGTLMEPPVARGHIDVRIKFQLSDYYDTISSALEYGQCIHI